MNGGAAQTEIQSRDVEHSPSQINVLGQFSTKVESSTEESDNNRKYTYACVDKLSKKPKVRRRDGYDEVVEFLPKIDKVENVTGSDTLIHENDLYSSPNSAQSVAHSDSRTSRTSPIIMEENSDLYDSPVENVSMTSERLNSAYDTVDLKAADIAHRNEDITTTNKNLHGVDNPSTIDSNPDSSIQKPSLSAIDSETIMAENADI